MKPQRFNLRVYGLLIMNDSVLITHENRADMIMTKFPGGGLEKGEGIEECLIREFREELDIAIEVKDHFYVNDFLQISRFNSSEQLLSFYYMVETKESDKIIVNVDKNELLPQEQAFEWVKLSELGKVDFSFPIDKVVVEKLG
jgi:8-oxo-dGTP pyrophosphatase MutT (NUDIX family)